MRTDLVLDALRMALGTREAGRRRPARAPLRPRLPIHLDRLHPDPRRPPGARVGRVSRRRLRQRARRIVRRHLQDRADRRPRLADTQPSSSSPSSSTSAGTTTPASTSPSTTSRRPSSKTPTPLNEIRPLRGRLRSTVLRHSLTQTRRIKTALQTQSPSNPVRLKARRGSLDSSLRCVIPLLRAARTGYVGFCFVAHGQSRADCPSSCGTVVRPMTALGLEQSYSPLVRPRSRPAFLVARGSSRQQRQPRFAWKSRIWLLVVDHHARRRPQRGAPTRNRVTNRVTESAN